MEYTVLYDDHIAKLIEKVNSAIKDGWSLQGGVARGGDYGPYCQAMIRKANAS